jgi:serine/threonine-protein kinase RsbW
LSPATFTRDLHSDPRELDVLLPELAAFLEQHGVEASVTYIVQLAVEELILNVIKHGCRGDVRRDIALKLDLDDARHATLEVEDNGDPFDLRTVPEPDFNHMLEGTREGGLGVHLIRSLANSIDYQRVNDRNRIRLRILPLPTR